jgi:hypothetical protein
MLAAPLAAAPSGVEIALAVRLDHHVGSRPRAAEQHVALLELLVGEGELG